MDLAAALEHHFGRTVDETIPPLHYRNASTYETLAATWTDARPLPSLAELESSWADWLTRQPVQPPAPNLDELQARIALLEDALLELLLGGEL